MIKLLVNLPRHKAGSIITADQIGEGRARQLLAAGQAEPWPGPGDAGPVSPLDQVLELIADARGVFAAFADRLKVVVVQAASLDDDDRMAVAVELRDLLLEQEPEEPGALAELLRLAAGQDFSPRDPFAEERAMLANWKLDLESRAMALDEREAAIDAASLVEGDDPDAAKVGGGSPPETSGDHGVGPTPSGPTAADQAALGPENGAGTEGAAAEAVEPPPAPEAATPPPAAKPKGKGRA